jgi:hypothetical protein
VADISMCQNAECVKSNNCYRFLAIPSLRQSYADFNLKRDKCFMPIPKYLRKEYKEG